MADTAAIVALVEAQAKAREQLTQSATLAAAAATRSFTGWYDSTAIGRWAASLLAIIRVLQRQSASLTDAYMARTASLTTGHPVAPIGAVDVTQLRGKVNMLEVYGRAADQYRYARSDGASADTALQRAVERATTIAETDVDLAVRAQGQQFMAKRNAVAYRRVIHPELPTEASLKAGGPPPPVCGLCVAASTRLYGPHEPMPIHANCRCLPLPLYDHGDDIGGAINDDALARLYAHAGSTSREDLKRTRYVVHEHGELGPVLTLHGRQFDGPRDIAARTTH